MTKKRYASKKIGRKYSIHFLKEKKNRTFVNLDLQKHGLFNGYLFIEALIASKDSSLM